MMVEIIVTLLIAISAAYFLYKNIKKKASGSCDCGHCSKSCSVRKTK
ncbi:MAG: FeoB-associated Cys-rich membrane protein [Bacillota bacterium]|nr:FeoB-associated Cys-rich membrane protein [Bacillota bacterium]